MPTIDEEIDLLIVRGVSSTDALAALGLPLALRYQRAKSVVLVPDGQRPRTVKGDAGTVEFVDADSRSSKIAEVIQRVKNEFERLRPNENVCQYLGLLFFYWMDPSDLSYTGAIELIESGDIAAFERAAERFIEADFGDGLHRLATLTPDGDDSTAAAGRRASSAASA